MNYVNWLARPVSYALQIATNCVIKKAGDRWNLIQLTLLCFCVLSSSAIHANFDQVTINGVNIDPIEFEGFKRESLADRYCYPHTDQLVVSRVVGRTLVIDYGRKKGFSNERIEQELSEIKQTVDTMSDDTERNLKAYMINSGAVTEHREYVKQYLRKSTPIDEESRYLELLSANSELMVDVTMLRTAKLSFNHRHEAEEVLERLVTGELFDDIANELGKDGDYYERKKSAWQHELTMPALADGESIEAGTLFDTWYNGADWEVRQALEVKQEPVLLLNDDIDESYSDLNYSIKRFTERQQLQGLVKRLWDSAEIMAAGKPLAYNDESDCGFPIILNHPDL